MLTNGKVSLESINNKMEQMYYLLEKKLVEQNNKTDEILDKTNKIEQYLNVSYKSKPKGDELKALVEKLTNEGYSIRQITKIAGCSNTAVSHYRRLIKNEKAGNEEIDF